ncbi:probable glycosyltransferase At5g03795 [Impatiens glandulifera]|uniref:probable glycosyltransferase At5g03795 n=1 Tax=Impatiens glandulifera TaxID=253017 RepID=UPI001FB12940|nr:probable glycosyltransferase At5g03795 [Impatiens glandulifera]
MAVLRQQPPSRRRLHPASPLCILFVLLSLLLSILSITSTIKSSTKIITTKPYNQPRPLNVDEIGNPYHNFGLFETDYEQMLNNLKIFVYPDIYGNSSSPFSNIFVPIPNPTNPKLGNYYSEHAFKSSLMRSSFVTMDPDRADLFFMPFSVNAMRNDRRLHSESSISDFVARYAGKIGSELGFWNKSGGADHFFVCCHSVGREAASKNWELRNNAIQVTCSSSYFQRFFLPHKDVALPQIWPRPEETLLNPPVAREKLVFFSGRVQNSRVRQDLLAMWENDGDMYINTLNQSLPYLEGFKRSRFCLHVKGYEVNTARVCDAIHYGCVPVIISNYYELPFANVLDWSKFAVIIRQEDISLLKKILLSISDNNYLEMYNNLNIIRKHFRWNEKPQRYDSFHMIIYQLWLRRNSHY